MDLAETEAWWWGKPLRHVEYRIPKRNVIEKSVGGPESLQAAAETIVKAKNPVTLAAGVTMSGDMEACTIGFREESEATNSTTNRDVPHSC